MLFNRLVESSRAAEVCQRVNSHKVMHCHGDAAHRPGPWPRWYRETLGGTGSLDWSATLRKKSIETNGPQVDGLRSAHVCELLIENSYDEAVYVAVASHFRGSFGLFCSLTRLAIPPRKGYSALGILLRLVGDDKVRFCNSCEKNGNFS